MILKNKYSLTRDTILRRGQITSNGLCPLITYPSFELDKKLCNPIGLLNFFGAGNQNRTDDLVITNDVLYRLSHTSIIQMAEREGFEPS